MCDMRALNEILALKSSGELTERLKRAEKGRRDLDLFEQRLRSRAFTKAQAKGVMAFDFSANNEKVLKETQAFEKMQRVCRSKRISLEERENSFCDWLGDRGLHLADLEAGAAAFRAYFEEYRIAGSEASKLPLDKFICEKMLKSSMAMVGNIVELQELIRHAYLASAAVGAEMPETVRKILESDEGYFTALKDQLFSDEYVKVIESLKTGREKSELVGELLRMLYPKNWKEYLAKTDDGFKEREKGKEKNDEDAKQWKERFAAEKMFTKFTLPQIRKFVVLAGHDVEKAIEFAKLADRGVFASDIYMLMKLDANASERRAHAAANAFLDLNGLSHEGICGAISSLDEEQLQEFPEKMRGYARWLRLIPEGIPARQELAAMLAFSVEPPQNPKDVFQLLIDKGPRILEQNKRMRNAKEDSLSAFSKYLCVMENVGAGREKMRPEEFTPPHDGIFFSRDLRWFIGEREVSAVDVRRLLVYGLRLASHKSMREGEYISAEAFRDAWRVLSRGERDRMIRSEYAEHLLRNEGVISFSRDKKLVRLNVDGGEEGKAPLTEMGEEILGMTNAWAVDIYPPPEEAEEEKEVEKAVSVPPTPEEEIAEEGEIAALAEQFGAAQGPEGKIAVLEELESFGEKAIPFFLAGKDDPHAEVRAFAIERLADIWDMKAVVISIEKLMYDEPKVQEAAARALGNIGASRGIRPLLVMLKKGTEEVQVECARALGKIGASEAVEHLYAVARNDTGGTVWLAAQQAITEITGEKKEEPAS